MAYAGSKIYVTGPVIFFILVILLFAVPAMAQPDDDYKQAKAALVDTLHSRFISDVFSQHIDRFYTGSCDSLIIADITVAGKPIRQLLLRLFEACSQKLNTRSIVSLQVPAINQQFLNVLHAWSKEAIAGICSRINIEQAGILGYVFDGSIPGERIRDHIGLQEMFNNPYFISSRIQYPQYSRFTDTLLYCLANGAPEILCNKLTGRDTFYTTRVKASDNKTIQAVSGLQQDSYYKLVLPFSLAIREGRITTGEIRLLALTPKDYYHAFAKEATRLHTNPRQEVQDFLKQPITRLNKYFANYYFIKEINDLHELPDAVRFRVLDSLPALDLYFLLLGGGSELVIGGSSALYTSSFLYVFNRFLLQTEKTGLNEFFAGINYYQFEQFMANISDYGLVDKLINEMDDETACSLLEKYAAGLPNNHLTVNESILNAMTMAEIFYEIRHHPNISKRLAERISIIQKQPELQEQFLYLRMYEAIIDLLAYRNQQSVDSIYNVFTINRLAKQGTIVEACFFYDDEDGRSSFQNSIASFDRAIWDKKDLGNFMVFSSDAANHMQVYMNKPNTAIGCDSAQNEMLQAIKLQGYEVGSFIHRGHSYHLAQSLAKITPAAQFVFLGSCGGYNQVLKLFQLNPNVHIIATRGVSSKLVNDVLLEEINRYILYNKDINWQTLWTKFGKRFQSTYVKDIFSSYVPPNKYIGVKFIRQVFNF